MHFNPAAAQARCHTLWGQNALPDAIRRFSIHLPQHTPAPWFLPMPPPNITGQLHLGHAMFLTLQDIKTRFHGLIGDETLWLPGTDHAGLATHSKIQEHMKAQGLDHDDKDQYMAIGWAWKKKLHRTITGQIKQMGAACDWTRERFTLDEAYQSSAREAFSRLWHDGLIEQRDGQWYADMTPMAQELIAAIEQGELDINPISSRNELLGMLRKIEPWCLSRQIFWGMPMPLKHHEGQWILDEGERTPGEPCADTLDTWFLSALWPFASLGWPEATPEMAKFYPGSWMETGDDILFFWCARMWMMGKYLTGRYPFQKLFLHGIILDGKGRKMSKSLGNGIDPLDIIEKFGTDALRWHLAMRADPARNMKFSEQAMASDAKWINKIWQSARFLLQFGPPQDKIDQAWPEELNDLRDQWATHLHDDQFPQAAKLLQAALRDGFSGTWIENNKERLREGDDKLLCKGWQLFFAHLKLLHPFLPHLTTDLHQRLTEDANEQK